MEIGYARVSTQEQETRMQIEALQKAGVEVIHEEKRSGADRKRPVLEAILAEIGPGDRLVVFKLDRVARSLAHLLEILDRIEQAGAQFVSLTEVIDTKSPAGRLMMQMIGAFAEFEREMIRERTRAGLQAAVSQGKRLGRLPAVPEEVQPEVVRQWRTGRYTKSALAKHYGVHISSIKRYLKKAATSIQPEKAFPEAPCFGPPAAARRIPGALGLEILRI